MKKLITILIITLLISNCFAQTKQQKYTKVIKTINLDSKEYYENNKTYGESKVIKNDTFVVLNKKQFKIDNNDLYLAGKYGQESIIVGLAGTIFGSFIIATTRNTTGLIIGGSVISITSTFSMTRLFMSFSKLKKSSLKNIN